MSESLCGDGSLRESVRVCVFFVCGGGGEKKRRREKSKKALSSIILTEKKFPSAIISARRKSNPNNSLIDSELHIARAQTRHIFRQREKGYVNIHLKFAISAAKKSASIFRRAFCEK